MGTGRQTFIGRTIRLVKGDEDALKIGEPDDLNNIIANIGSVLWSFTIVGALLVLRLKVGTSTADCINIWVCCTMICIYANSRGFIANTRAMVAAAMTEQGAVVQSLWSIDILAGIDVLCCDKTGTLTENRVRLFGY
jgi:H+-transporting ATPase